MRKILFASSEVHPLMKSGGLADVSASLPRALREKGLDIRIMMPGYRAVLQACPDRWLIADLKLEGYHRPVQIWQTVLPGGDVPVYLLDSPEHFDRDGGPYGRADGTDWPDNAARFALFARAIAAMASQQIDRDWQVDLCHLNDWQTGLAAPILLQQAHRPQLLFTIHNLAYQGNFSRAEFDALDLPSHWWSMDGVEFYGRMSMLKAGIQFADHITTVSPSYAREICQAEYGFGMEGLLAFRAQQGHLTGILNGIDQQEWNPAQDPHLVKPYHAGKIRDKRDNKQALQNQFYLPARADQMLVGLVSRLVSQKGVDLSLSAIRLCFEAQMPIQLVCLGSGDRAYEQALLELRAEFPDKVGLHIGYNEALAHQIEAGADVFLMPSRFEPCGLNQLYSLRYGTLPIVRRTGGLADSVVDADPQNRKEQLATGFVFTDASVEALYQTLERAYALFQRPRIWRNMVRTAMEQDFGWAQSANQYEILYTRLLDSGEGED